MTRHLSLVVVVVVVVVALAGCAAEAPDAPAAARADIAQMGRDAGQGNLLGLQPWLVPDRIAGVPGIGLSRSPGRSRPGAASSRACV